MIGDVSGKGVAAALFMAASQGAVKSAFLGRAEIATIAAEVAAIAEDTNRRLCSQNPMGMFVTCMLAMVNLENGAVDYVCAGHEPAFLIGSDDSRRVLPLTGGLAMGLMEDFDYSSGHEVLQPGETLFMYTDGLTDATDRNGELFGKERLEGTLHGSSRQSAGAHRGQYLEPDRELLGRHRGRRRHDLPRFAAPVNFANREGRFPAWIVCKILWRWKS